MLSTSSGRLLVLILMRAKVLLGINKRKKTSQIRAAVERKGGSSINTDSMKIIFRLRIFYSNHCLAIAATVSHRVVVLEDTASMTVVSVGRRKTALFQNFISLQHFNTKAVRGMHMLIESFKICRYYELIHFV